MLLPTPRGPLSTELFAALRQPPGDLPALPGPDGDEDLQIALFACYELHYRGFADVTDDWEWAPSLLAVRHELETRFLTALRELVPATMPRTDVAKALFELVAADDGPALSAYVQRRATGGQFAEFAIHRSIYQLKEADPHSWGIPRVHGRTKAALIEIQADEYGNGRVERMHSELFRRTLRGLGLDDTYCAYVDDVPAVTLATSNVISLFGLHRKYRGMLLGHLAAFEMTSSLPNRKYGNGLRRLGHEPATTGFYDEHVTADAVHEQVAAHDLCGSLVADEPSLAADVLFGARVCLALEALFGGHLLTAWRAGRSSLRCTASLELRSGAGLEVSA